jgi:hypothetical protein
LTVTETVRVPDPVKRRIESEAERQDVTQGTIVKTWMKNAEKFEEMETRK